MNSLKKELNLENLQSRSACFDLSTCYKVLFGLVCVNTNEFFVSSK